MSTFNAILTGMTEGFRAAVVGVNRSPWIAGGILLAAITVTFLGFARPLPSEEGQDPSRSDS